jgi:hypothetical protein
MAIVYSEYVKHHPIIYSFNSMSRSPGQFEFFVLHNIECDLAYLNKMYSIPKRTHTVEYVLNSMSNLRLLYQQLWLQYRITYPEEILKLHYIINIQRL